MPSNSEEDHRLVNQSIAYFGAVVGLLSLALFVFTLLLGVAINPNWKRHLLEAPSLLHLGAASVFGSLWLLCRKGRRSSFQLNVLDVGGLVLTSALYSLMIAWAPTANFLQSLILT